MKTIQVLYGQTIVDIALQELGDPERAVEVAELNSLSLSDDLDGGQLIDVPDYDSDKRDLVNLFTNKANAPASADTGSEVDAPLEGIDYWAIQIDFKVT